ncbi:MAG: hypothetical protein GY755_13820 [Chloroflexi bacterium]|nr:hypothetical protein [Chloroflexota bacterium]
MDSDNWAYSIIYGINGKEVRNSNESKTCVCDEGKAAIWGMNAVFGRSDLDAILVVNASIAEEEAHTGGDILGYRYLQPLGLKPHIGEISHYGMSLTITKMEWGHRNQRENAYVVGDLDKEYTMWTKKAGVDLKCAVAKENNIGTTTYFLIGLNTKEKINNKFNQKNTNKWNFSNNNNNRGINILYYKIKKIYIKKINNNKEEEEIEDGVFKDIKILITILGLGFVLMNKANYILRVLNLKNKISSNSSIIFTCVILFPYELFFFLYISKLFKQMFDVFIFIKFIKIKNSISLHNKNTKKQKNNQNKKIKIINKQTHKILNNRDKKNTFRNKNQKTNNHKNKTTKHYNNNTHNKKKTNKKSFGIENYFNHFRHLGKKNEKRFFKNDLCDCETENKISNNNHNQSINKNSGYSINIYKQKGKTNRKEMNEYCKKMRNCIEKSLNNSYKHKNKINKVKFKISGNIINIHINNENTNIKWLIFDGFINFKNTYKCTNNWNWKSGWCIKDEENESGQIQTNHNCNNCNHDKECNHNKEKLYIKNNNMNKNWKTDSKYKKTKYKWQNLNNNNKNNKNNNLKSRNYRKNKNKNAYRKKNKNKNKNEIKHYFIINNITEDAWKEKIELDIRNNKQMKVIDCWFYYEAYRKEENIGNIIIITKRKNKIINKMKEYVKWGIIEYASNIKNISKDDYIKYYSKSDKREHKAIIIGMKNEKDIMDCEKNIIAMENRFIKKQITYPNSEGKWIKEITFNNKKIRNKFIGKWIKNNKENTDNIRFRIYTMKSSYNKLKYLRIANQARILISNKIIKNLNNNIIISKKNKNIIMKCIKEISPNKNEIIDEEIEPHTLDIFNIHEIDNITESIEITEKKGNKTTVKKNFSIINQNIGGAIYKNMHAEAPLQKEIALKNPIFITIQEHQKNNLTIEEAVYNIEIPGYTLIAFSKAEFSETQKSKKTEDKGRPSGGLITWMRNDFHNDYNINVIKNTNYIQNIEIKHKTDNNLESFSLTNTYLTTFEKKIKEKEKQKKREKHYIELTNIMNNTTMDNIIIVGDLNSRNKQIGDKITNNNGKELIKFINKQNATIINETEKYGIKTYTGMNENESSIVDIIIIQNKNKNKIVKMEINDIHMEKKILENEKNNKKKEIKRLKGCRHSTIWTELDIKMKGQENIGRYKYAININNADKKCLMNYLHNRGSIIHNKILMCEINEIKKANTEEEREKIAETIQKTLFAFHQLIAIKIFGIKKVNIDCTKTNWKYKKIINNLNKKYMNEITKKNPNKNKINYIKNKLEKEIQKEQKRINKNRFENKTETTLNEIFQKYQNNNTANKIKIPNKLKGRNGKLIRAEIAYGEFVTDLMNKIEISNNKNNKKNNKAINKNKIINNTVFLNKIKISEKNDNKNINNNEIPKDFKIRTIYDNKQIKKPKNNNEIEKLHNIKIKRIKIKNIKITNFFQIKKKNIITMNKNNEKIENNKENNNKTEKINIIDIIKNKTKEIEFLNSDEIFEKQILDKIIEIGETEINNMITKIRKNKIKKKRDKNWFNKIKKYKKNAKNKNINKINYKKAEKDKTKNGRNYCEKGIGMQNFNKLIRGALAYKYYYDIEHSKLSPSDTQ